MRPHDPQGSQQAQLHEQLAILRLRKWWMIAVTVVIVAGVVGMSLLQDPTYVAEARVLVRPVPLGTSGDVERPNMITERQLARSSPVTSIAAATLAEPADDIIGGLGVDVIDETEILIFSYTSGEPAAAARGAQAFADAYLSFRQQQAREESAASAASLRQELQLQAAQLRTVNRRLATTRSDIARASLEAQQLTLASQIATMRNRLAGLEATDSARVGRIVLSAVEPEVPTGPKPIRNGILALFAGAALGIAVAFGVDRMDDRIRGPETIEAMTGSSSLSVVLHLPSEVREAGLVTLQSGASPYAEAYRTLRTGLMFAAAGRGARVIVVTSPNPGDGKTYTTANLGIAIAQTGKRVVLVSADLRRPRLHREFGISAGPGLTELLAERRSVWEMLVRPEGTENLWILPSGAPTATPPDLLASRGMADVLERLRESADYVLIDVGPVLAVPDALAVAPAADAVLLVVAAERTTRSAVRHAVRQLQLVRAVLIGTVLNGFRPRGSGSPYYYADYMADEATPDAEAH
jgi:capsular exopolysaccharide synthesis family protein